MLLSSIAICFYRYSLCCKMAIWIFCWLVSLGMSLRD